MKFHRLIKVVLFSLILLAIGALFKGSETTGIGKPAYWSGIEPFRWVMVDSASSGQAGVFLVNYYPHTNEILVLVAPPDLTVEVLHYGKYQIASIPQLSQNERMDDQLVRVSLSNAFGLAFRTVLDTDLRMSETSVEEVRRRVRKAVTKLILNQEESELGFWDRLRAGFKIYQVKTSGYRVELMNHSKISEVEVDIDGTNRYLLNQLKLDVYLSEWQKKYFISQEVVTAYVENTTNIPGLASQISRILTNEGFQVIRIDDNFSTLPYTLVITEANYKLPNYRMSQLKYLFKQADFRNEDTSDYRSQVVVRLGVKDNGITDGFSY